LITLAVLLLLIGTPTSASTQAGEPIVTRGSAPVDWARALEARLGGIIGGRKLAVAIVPVSSANGVDPVGYQADQQYPVASAFKGPVAIYFLEFTAPSLWRSVPIRYWGATKPEQIPAEFQGVWSQYGTVLHDLYMMAVLSENDATGRILTYVWKNTSAGQLGENPLRAFNNWSRDRVGIGEKSGLRAWLVGQSICPNCQDNRLEAQPLIYARKIFYHNNTYTAADLAKYWVYLATQGRHLGYFDAAEILMQNAKYGLVHKTTARYHIFSISKDGYIAPYSEYGNGYRISTDAGLLRLPDGEEYAVAYMAFDSGDLLEPSIHAMSQVLLAAQRAEF
jgi:hypothetical protein